MKTYPVYLNGELTITEKTYEVTNPAKGEAVARMSQLDRAAVAQEIEHAHAAFRSWRNLPGKKRGEVAMTVDHLTWFAEEARRGYGRFVPNQLEGKRHLVIKTPIGVVAAISPWNFPLVLAVRKIAPALAAGCTVVLKPASKTPMCAAVFAECVDAVKLPKGVFQMVAGSASEIGKEFLENPLCRKITFTGSTEVG